MIDLDRLSTEQRNPASVAIDTVSTQELVEIINREDHKVADAVEKILPAIALAVDLVADRLSRGGRLFYMGSGTSGRLGILDAVLRTARIRNRSRGSSPEDTKPSSGPRKGRKTAKNRAGTISGTRS